MGKTTSKKSNKVSNASKKESFIGSLLAEKWAQQVIFVAVVIILLYFVINHISIFTGFVAKVISILSPIIVGFVLTYLLSPLYNLLVEKITKRREKYYKDKSKLAKFAKSLATLICVVIVILVATGLIFLFVPQLYNSITSFFGRASGYLDTFKETVSDFKENTKAAPAKSALDSIEKTVQDTIAKTKNLENADLNKIVIGVYNGFYLSLKVILNAFVGLVVMIYSLNMKVELCTGAKRLLFALFQESAAKKILAEVRYAHKIFSGFLVGKFLDSLIIGILCYVCCLIMRMPYTPLIAVIVGITNIIPFFGPFIGAIPCFIIIFLDQPLSWKPYGFILFILILQQIDGNIIGPKILGDKTGVGSFWVLFSILLFGGLFGFIGMIVAVPLWAIITRLFDEFIVNKLKEKGQPLTVDEYARLKGYTEDIEKAKK